MQGRISNAKPLQLQGSRVPSAFPKSHWAVQDLRFVSYSSKGILFSLPPTAGVGFQLVSQDYLGTINKQDLICANPNTAVHYWKAWQFLNLPGFWSA